MQVTTPNDDIIIKLGIKVPMRDGIKLSTNIFFPNEKGSFPTILMRTPYGKGDENNDTASAYAKAGYAYVIQDTRGRFESDGLFNPYINEAQDGYDTQEWLLKQPWCNGKIGTAGGSYVGFTQWISAPSSVLRAMFPMICGTEIHDDAAFVGGAFQLALYLWWNVFITWQPEDDNLDWDELYRCLPLTGYSKIIGRKMPFYDDLLAHPDYDEFWLPVKISDKFDRINIPVFSMGNWYDPFAKSTIDAFCQMKEQGPTEEIRLSQRLLMGPGGHGLPDSKLGEREFGEIAVIDLASIEHRWFDHWLKGENNGIMDEPPVRIFIMGVNQWHDEQEWPLARTNYTRYYLHSDGKANTLNGDGILGLEPSIDESADTYRYDPNNPVPTNGGANLILPSGPFDQRKIEERFDVLVYTTEPLKEPLEVTGPIRLILYASSSALDTDFTAKLVDVCPDGIAWNLTEGIIRARYRKSTLKQELIQPGKVYRYEIDLQVTSNVFLEGHRIRLEVSSSNFPRFDRNPNTGHTFGSDAEIITAEQTIYHNREYPSHLVLPIIPVNRK